MIDKLILLSSTINHRVQELAVAKGWPTRGYERCLDLSETDFGLPARLYFRGRRNNVHKIELIGVAMLGRTRVQEIVEQIFPDSKRIRIYRIDLSVDIVGITPWFFVLNCTISRRQNYSLHRSRTGVSFYLESSHKRRTLFYDRGRLLKLRHHPVAKVFANTQLTRVEVQLTSSSVPYRRFVDIKKYSEFNPLADIEFFKLRTDDHPQTPVKILAAFGLRWLIRRYGQQAVSRRFPASAWSAIRKTYLVPMEKTEIPPIRRLMRESIERWMRDEIRFLRAP
jgi:hypothetical protein